VALRQFHCDAVGREFGTQCCGPLLEEGFAAAVGGEEGAGDEAAGGTHGQDESAFSLDHAGSDGLGYAEGGGAVYCYDGCHLIERRVHEWYGYCMADSDIVD